MWLKLISRSVLKWSSKGIDVPVGPESGGTLALAIAFVTVYGSRRVQAKSQGN